VQQVRQSDIRKLTVAFIIMVFGGMITIMLLGFLLQISDPDFAGIMEVDQNDEAEKGQAKKVSRAKGKGKDGPDVTRKNSQTKIGSKTSFPPGMQR
jgi:hypothetical protein